jgi:DNA-binding response OmpR family regulator
MSLREAELEETVLQLRRLLHIEPERVKVDAPQAGLSLTRTQALLLVALHDAGASWMPFERLYMVLPENANDPRTDDCVRVHISHLRARLEPDAILGKSKMGYTLGAPGVLACKRALSAGGAA